VSAPIHEITLSLWDANSPGQLWLVYPALDVLELPPTIPFDVLIGLDVVRQIRMWVDGPGGIFTLDA